MDRADSETRAIGALPFGFCRNCLHVQSRRVRRCEACLSPAIIDHGELERLAIAHIDCDAFYASIEKRDRPELIDRPVIVGGGTRGVVTTACYLARINGVRSAMPMFKALKLCPNATIVRPDMAKYAAVGRQIRTMMGDLSPLVQPVSIDEAFIDLGGTAAVHRAPPALVLARFARRVEAEIGITVSVGLSCNKFLAKLASDMNKPQGFTVIGQSEAPALLAKLPVGSIWGVGERFAEKLSKDGLVRIAQLQAMDLETLSARYGSMGSRLYHLSRGLDDRPVKVERERKSVSSETTFDRDIASMEQLRPILRRLCEKVAARLREDAIAGSTIVLKLKTARFVSRTRNRQLSDPTARAGRIFDTAMALLEPELDGTPFRLIGVGIADLVSSRFADPPDLVDPKSEKAGEVENVVARLRARFGDASVETGITFGYDKRGRRQDGDAAERARRPDVIHPHDRKTR